MGRAPKVETKQVTLDIRHNKGARELVKLQEQGWEIVSEHKRGLLDFSPGQVDYVLRRVTGGTPKAAPAAPPVPPPPAGPPAGWYPDASGQPGLQRYWDGSAWTEHVHQS